MPGEMVDFSTLSPLEKMKILGRGMGLQISNFGAALKHDSAPRKDLREFKSKPRYQLPPGRVDRNPLDAALNYSGGYDFASQPGVTQEDAIDLAKAYQLFDYIRAMSLERELDAQRDFGENVAGVVSAQDPTSYLKMMQNAANYGRNTERKAKGGLIQMKGCNCG